MKTVSNVWGRGGGGGGEGSSLSLASIVESVGETREAVVYPLEDISGSSPLISSPWT